MKLGDAITYNARELGLNGVSVTGTPRNSNPFGADGCNNIAINYKYVRSAGTTLSFVLQCSDDNFTTTMNIATESLNLGAGTIYNLTHSDGDQAASPGNQTKTLFYPIMGITGRNYRIGSITCTSGGASDLFTATVDVGLMP